MDTEEVVQNLIAQNRAQAKQIEDLTTRLNTALKALEFFTSLNEDERPTNQYTWDEANKQFRVDL